MDQGPEPKDGCESTGKATGRGVLEGAFLLLEELTQVGEVGLTALAAGAGLPKGTAYRLLNQLVGLGAVQRRAGRYRMGSRMFHLGQAWQPASLLRAAAQHPLRQLAEATQASVNVALSDSGRVVVAGGMRGEVDEVVPIRAGLVLPVGNAAEILLATDQHGATRPQRHSSPEWRRLVANAREQGLAFDYENLIPSVSCVVAPVRASSGKIIGTVAAAVLDGRRLPSLAPVVRRTADMVSAKLARVPEAADDNG